MGGFGAADLGMLLADKLAGVWISAGAWKTADFRAFYGTPVYLQHGKYDTAYSYRGGGKQPRSITATSQFYARAADELMTRDQVEHVFDEHDGGHALTWEPAQLATRRFLAWAAEHLDGIRAGNAAAAPSEFRQLVRRRPKDRPAVHPFTGLDI